MPPLHLLLGLQSLPAPSFVFVVRLGREVNQSLGQVSLLLRLGT